MFWSYCCEDRSAPNEPHRVIFKAFIRVLTKFESFAFIFMISRLFNFTCITQFPMRFPSCSSSRKSASKAICSIDSIWILVLVSFGTYLSWDFQYKSKKDRHVRFARFRKVKYSCLPLTFNKLTFAFAIPLRSSTSVLRDVRFYTKF